MLRRTAIGIALGAVLAATAAGAAEHPMRDEVQAPRTQAIQAPRDRQDEQQAPRGHDRMQGPRGSTTPAPRR